MQSLTIAVAALSCCAAVFRMRAQDAPATQLPNVTYSAAGTFATPQISGSDLFRLAGEPFQLYIVSNEDTHPVQHGRGWGAYSGQKMKGEVTSGLDPQSPFRIQSSHAFLVLAIGNPNADDFQVTAPVEALKQKIMITAKLTIPHGTMAKWLIYPFTAPAALSPASGTVSYSDGTNTTVLAIQTGTLNGVKGSPR
jgi:hypothetical protein